MEGNPEYSVVIPVYNSENSLAELISRIIKVLTPISENFEIILVDDGSYDNSWSVLKNLSQKDNRIKGFRLMRNFGQHNALICGFNHATGENIITLDDDLQNPPEEIPKLITKKKTGGFDVVYGEYISKKHSIFRNLGSGFIQFLYKRIFKVKKNFTTFRIISGTVIRNVVNYKSSFVFIDGLIAYITRNIGYADVEHKKRTAGSSNYNPAKLLKLSFNMLTNFTIFPLQFTSFLGFIFAIAGFVLGIYFLIRKLFFDISVPGYASLIITIAVFSGVQLISLGLIGEYLGRIHLNINQHPQFIIKETSVDYDK